MSEGWLTTHVLDTTMGRPGVGIVLRLYRVGAEGRALLAEASTNSDGRTDAPLLPKEDFAAGTYEIVFVVGAYLKAHHGERTGARPFLDEVPIRFTMAEAAHYHVPLLLSPHGYSTYRGS